MAQFQSSWIYLECSSWSITPLKHAVCWKNISRRETSLAYVLWGPCKHRYKIFPFPKKNTGGTMPKIAEDVSVCLCYCTSLAVHQMFWACSYCSYCYFLLCISVWVKIVRHCRTCYENSTNGFVSALWPLTNLLVTPRSRDKSNQSQCFPKLFSKRP